MKLCLDGPVGNVVLRTYSGPSGLAAGLAVKQGAAGDRTLLAVSGADQQCLGLLNETDQLGDGVYGVVVEGEAFGISGAALACDIDVIADVNGNLIPSTAQGDNIVGRTRTSCAEAGDQVLIHVRPYTR